MGERNSGEPVSHCSAGNPYSEPTVHGGPGTGCLVARLAMFVGPLIFVLWVFCFIQAVTSRDSDVRNLPKVAWILLVLFFPLIGSVAWLAAGRPRSPRPRAYERPATAFPEYDRPGRAAAVTAESDEEFLRRCRERAEEQRRRAREQAQGQEEQPGEG